MGKLTQKIADLTEFELPGFDDDDLPSAIVQRYNQGKDVGLSSHPDTIEGVCIALSLRWLDCKVNGSDFWKTCVTGKALNAPTVTFVQEAMSSLAKSPGGHGRLEIIRDIAHKAGIAPFVPAAGDPLLWSAGDCGPSGAGVVAELWSRRAHAIVALKPPNGKAGDGHAIGFASGTKSGWIFDPNFGEIRLASRSMATEVFAALWKKKNYAGFTQFDITRYHPTLK